MSFGATLFENWDTPGQLPNREPFQQNLTTTFRVDDNRSISEGAGSQIGLIPSDPSTPINDVPEFNINTAVGYHGEDRIYFNSSIGDQIYQNQTIVKLDVPKEGVFNNQEPCLYVNNPNDDEINPEYFLIKPKLRKKLCDSEPNYDVVLVDNEIYHPVELCTNRH